jgi:stage V sporulation protein AE
METSLIICALCLRGVQSANGQILNDRTTLTPARILVITLIPARAGRIGHLQAYADWGWRRGHRAFDGYAGNSCQRRGTRRFGKRLSGAFTGVITATAGGIAARYFFVYLVASFSNQKRSP